MKDQQSQWLGNCATGAGGVCLVAFHQAQGTLADMSYIPQLRTPLDTRRFGSGRAVGASGTSGSATRGTTVSSTAGQRVSSTTTRTASATADRFARPHQVRFNSNLKPSESLSMSQRERERRKAEALNFLKRETSNSSIPSLHRGERSSTLRGDLFGNGSPLRKSRIDFIKTRSSPTRLSSRDRDPASLKTYELLGEKPISRIGTLPSRTALYDDQILKNITRESLRRNPLATSPSRPNLSSSRISKPSTATPTSYTMKNTSLLNSLSNFGSKVFKSILYSEDEQPSIAVNSTYSPQMSSSASQDFRRNENSLRKQREIDFQLEERRRYLEQLNEEIARAETKSQQINYSAPVGANANDTMNFMDQSHTIDKQIEKLDNRLQNILNEVNIGSNAKLLEELGGIKDELASLRKRQETNNIKFESRFEDIKLENQKNRQKFDRLYQDLEDKKKELDLEKSALLKLLKSEKSGNKGKIGILKSPSVRFESSDGGKSVFGNDDEGNGDNDEDGDDENENEYEDEEDEDEDEDDTGAIIRFLLKNKRGKDLKSSRVRNSRVRKIRNNLNKIDIAANKGVSRVGKEVKK